METKNPVWELGEPLFPLSLSAFTPFLTLCYFLVLPPHLPSPGLSPIHLPHPPSFPLPHPCLCPFIIRTQSGDTLLCQVMAPQPVAQTASRPSYSVLPICQFLAQQTTEDNDDALYLSVVQRLRAGQKEASQEVVCKLSFPSSLLAGMWT